YIAREQKIKEEKVRLEGRIATKRTQLEINVGTGLTFTSSLSILLNRSRAIGTKIEGQRQKVQSLESKLKSMQAQKQALDALWSIKAAQEILDKTGPQDARANAHAQARLMQAQLRLRFLLGGYLPEELVFGHGVDVTGLNEVMKE